MSLSVQFFSLLAMIGTGIVAAALIDIIGTGIAHAGKRSLIRKHRILLEVVGWILVGFWTFTILYRVRDGAWKIYDPFAQLSGLYLYISIFHRPLRVLGRMILVLLLKPIWFVLRAILLMINYLFKGIIKFFKILSTPFISIFRKFLGKYFKKQSK